LLIDVTPSVSRSRPCTRVRHPGSASRLRESWALRCDGPGCLGRQSAC